MERMTMAVPCLFGLEGLVGDELRRMGMETGTRRRSPRFF